MGKVSVRYIVADVDAAIAFYTEMLGFAVDLHPSPGLPGCREETSRCS
jgi:catechol 2,3-dioxygenase-like lactoylglutathione lyase family enzyme